LVPVLAQSRRCARAPAFAARWERREASSSRYALGDRNTNSIAQFARDLSTDCDIPAANKERGDRGHCRVEPGLDALLDAAQVGFSRRNILLSRKQKRDVDWNASEDRCLDGGQSFRSAWNLDEEVRFARALVEIARGR
jgi:hypothetical protein